MRDLKSIAIVTFLVFVLIVIFAVVIGPLVQRVDYQANIFTIGWWRFFWAVIGLGLYIYWEKVPSPKACGGIERLLTKDYLVIGAGFFLATSYLGYMYAYRLTSHLAPALNLGSTSVLWIIAIGWFIGRREDKEVVYISIGITILVLYLFIPNQSGGVNSYSILTLLSSGLFAGFLLLADKLSRPPRIDAVLLALSYCLIGMLLSLPGWIFDLFVKGASGATFSGVFHLQTITIGLATALALILYTKLLEHMSSLILSLLLLLIPVANVIFDWMFLGNRMTNLEIGGIIGTIIGLGAIYYIRIETDRSRRLPTIKKNQRE